MSKLLNSARMYLRNIDLAFGYMASFPLKKTESDRYVLSWSVIRYLDCIIDSSATICSKQTALNRYMEITDDYILNGKLPNIETEVDSFMTEYLKLEKISTIKTIDCFRNILNSFKMDISRHDKILSWDEYDDYLIYRSDSVLELYYRLLFQRIDPWVKKLAHHYARVFQYVDDVLDFFDDIEIGQINITKNEMQKIGLSNIADIKTEKIELFYNMRKELIANHFLAFIEMLVEKSDLPYSLRRYLEESIGYNITPYIPRVGITIFSIFFVPTFA